MTTEIDLTTVKALIDRAFVLKKEKGLLLQQVNKSQGENITLKEQLIAKEHELQSQNTELSNKLKQQEAQQQVRLVELTDSHRVAMENQVRSTQVECEVLKESHEAALSTLASDLSQKNTQLSAALEHAEQQNKALVNRIKGVEL